MTAYSVNGLLMRESKVSLWQLFRFVMKCIVQSSSDSGGVECASPALGFEVLVWSGMLV